MLPAVHDQVGAFSVCGWDLRTRVNWGLRCVCDYRLDALAFIPSKSQRKLVNRFNRFVIHGDEKEEGMEVDGQAGRVTPRHLQ